MEAELAFRGLSRKELSALSGVPMTTINRAMERDSNPFALDAVRIAQALELSIEFLLELPQKPLAHKLELYQKYHAVIDTLESLPLEKKDTLVQIVADCASLAR